ncbi:MAG: DNA primase [Fimbriimonadales bacterium]|nr:MAG: DNA primase [Fimbriimonadales bacterium]
MPDDKEVVRSRIDLVDLVSERVALKKTGKTYRGLCPFHEEDTASFYVYPDSQTYHCFGCQKNGDVFSWVMETENVDFRSALEILAARAGVQLRATGHGKGEDRDKRAALMEAALTFFRNRLLQTDEAMEYARSRGLDDLTLDRWEIGYAPDEDFALAMHLKKQGFALAMAAECSLLTGDQGSGYRDFFRRRLIFPIRDPRGKLVGFGGRLIGAGEPKYLNSRDTPDFHKSSTLYGLHLARPELQKSRHIVLCEGYLDVIACHRAGIKTACAPLGTAFNQQHAVLVKRWADSATLVYDSDSAGRSAALKCRTILESRGIRVRIALLPEGLDPDTVLAEQGPVALSAAVENALSPTKFLAESLRREVEQGGEIPAEFWDRLVRSLAEEGDPLESIQVLDELSTLHPAAKTDRAAAARALVEKFERERKRVSGRQGQAQPAEVAGEETKKARVSPAEALVLRAAVNDAVRHLVRDRLTEEGLLYSPDALRIAEAIRETGADSGNAILANLDPEAKHLLLSLTPPPDPFRGPPPLDDRIIQGALSILEKEREKRQRGIR